MPNVNEIYQKWKILKEAERSTALEENEKQEQQEKR